MGRKSTLVCGGTIHVGAKWFAHHNATGHTGEKLRLSQKRHGHYREQVDCEIGCGLSLQHDRIRRPQKLAHYRCIECDAGFIATCKNISIAIKHFPARW